MDMTQAVLTAIVSNHIVDTVEGKHDGVERRGGKRGKVGSVLHQKFKVRKLAAAGMDHAFGVVYAHVMRGQAGKVAGRSSAAHTEIENHTARPNVGFE